MTTEHLQAEWVSFMLHALSEAGIFDVVISPGSRSTPLVIAIVRQPRFRVHVVVDERTASFFALGQARLTARPTLLVCTSGSAPGHYLPAILEAQASYIPLLVLTADRPLRLQDCGANQTLDQTCLFGHHVRKFIQVHPPSIKRSAFYALRRQMVQAVLKTMEPLPGVVHMNIHLDKPLEPKIELSKEELSLSEEVRAWEKNGGPTCMVPSKGFSIEQVDTLLDVMQGAQRGLVICGPFSPKRDSFLESLNDLIQRTGFLFYAEATSQCRFTTILPRDRSVDQLELLLRNPSIASGYQPDFILQLGAVPTAASTGSLDHFLKQSSAVRVVVTAYGWNDPQHQASWMVCGDPESLLRALQKRIEERSLSWCPDRVLEKSLLRANEKAWEVVDLHLQEINQPLSEPQAIAEVISSLPADSLLIIGNSLPIREVDAYSMQGATRVQVLSQRGLSGIDGLIAGATGTFSCSIDPVTLLIGDVSFLHDASSLALIVSLDRPFVIVVIANQGARIFEQLPVARHFSEDVMLAHCYRTEHTLSIQAIASAHGHAYEKASSRSELKDALSRSYQKPRITIVEASVDPQSASRVSSDIQKQMTQEFSLPSLVNATNDKSNRSKIFSFFPKKDSVVLLHGFTLGPSMFDQLCERWAPDRIFRPFLLGHGQNPLRVAETFGRNLFCDEVDRVARHIERFQEGKGPSHLLGYSMGARIALGLLVRHPRLFSGATLISVHPGLGTAEDRNQRRLVEEQWSLELEQQGLPFFVRNWEEKSTFISQKNLKEKDQIRQREIRLSNEASALALSIRALGLSRMPYYLPSLSSLRIPVHLITGQLDQDYVMLSKKIATIIPQCRQTVIQNSGHNPLWEQPDSCIDAVICRWSLDMFPIQSEFESNDVR